MKKQTYTALIFILFVCLSISCNGQNKFDVFTKSNINFEVSSDQSKFLDTLQYRTFLFFWNECNPNNGLVKDRSTNDSPSSIASTGFAIPAWAIGIEHGWIDRNMASERTLTLLKFLINSDESDKTLTTGYKGFYYHFLDMNTGKRFWNCELSSIDTAWLLAGIRFASQYYSNENEIENEIRILADSITYRIDWDWMTQADPKEKNDSSVAMGWWPETGFGNARWTGYNEALFLYILAAGSNFSYATSTYSNWLKYYEWCEPNEKLAHVAFPPLFGHQYSHMFIDFRGIYDSYMEDKGIDYFENSRRATLAQRQYAIDNPLGWKGYDSLTWGLTACDGPLNDLNNLDQAKFRGYSARGPSDYCIEYFDDGTITPTAAGGSIVFAPELVIPTLISMQSRFGEAGLWGKYGFKDAFNSTVNWIGTDYIGIDQGPILIMIENLRTGLIWKYIMRDPVIKNGLLKLGFSKVTAN